MQNQLENVVATKHDEIIKDYKEESGLYSDFKELFNATIDQFDSKFQLIIYAKDIINHGISGGFGGFIAYHDTVNFAIKHRKDIIKYARRQATEIGYDSYFSMIANFGSLRKYDISIQETAELLYEGICESCALDRNDFYNALTWYIAEEVCNDFILWAENNDHYDSDFEAYADDKA